MIFFGVEVSEKLLHPPVKTNPKVCLLLLPQAWTRAREVDRKIETGRKKSSALPATLESGERRINGFYRFLCEEILALSHFLNKNKLLHV